MKKLIYCVVIVLSLALSFKFSVFAENTDYAVFLDGFEDLPLMRGLVRIENEGISFDSISGSIVQVYVAAEKVNKNQVFSFYNRTLPQLGWIDEIETPTSKTFSRDGQNLTIELTNESSPLIFKFELKPSGE